MKTELRAVPHAIVTGPAFFEVWHEGQFIATITGADGPGVRVISKHTMKAEFIEGYPNEVEVKIEK
jgi:hypothetical protein